MRVVDRRANVAKKTQPLARAEAGFVAVLRDGHARHMFKGQWESGLLPHINFHKVDPGYFPGPEMWGQEQMAGRPFGLPTSGITQPVWANSKPTMMGSGTG